MKNWKLWIGLAVSAILIIWAFSRVEFDKLGQALAHTDYLYLMLCLPFFWLSYVGRALRWDYILRPVAKVPYKSLLSASVIGFTANLILPARLGEIVRAAELSRREQVPTVAGLATIGMERILDGIFIIGFLIMSAIMLGIMDSQDAVAQAARKGVIFFSIAYVIILAVVAAVAVRPAQSLKLITIITGLLPAKFADKINDMAASIVDALMLVRKPKLLLIAVAYTIGIWIINAIPFHLMALAVGTSVPFTASLLVQGIVCLAIALPQAPDYVGTMHAAIQFGYGTLMGMSPQNALAVAILYHGTMYLFTVIYCLKFLVGGKTSLFELGKMAKTEQESDVSSKG